MARARNIKFGFFTNDELVELPFETRLLFIGLWCIADREGRLVDRPKKIKMEVFPSDDVDCEKSLAMLAGKGFIKRYQVGSHKVIEILKFIQHQKPHSTEKDSALPDEGGFLTVHERSKNGGVTGVASKIKMAVEANNVKPPLEPVNPTTDNALNVECGMWNPDLLNVECGILNHGPSPEEIEAEQFAEVWAAYPKRPGASKADSLKAWKARIKAGAAVGDILAGVVRYAAFVAFSGTEPQYIKQPATFFGPGKHHEADWTLPVSGSPPRYQTANDKAKTLADRLTGKTRNDSDHNIIDINDRPS
jgi:hypothetical protein